MLIPGGHMQSTLGTQGSMNRGEALTADNLLINNLAIGEGRKGGLRRVRDDFHITSCSTCKTFPFGLTGQFNRCLGKCENAAIFERLNAMSMHNIL